MRKICLLVIMALCAFLSCSAPGPSANYPSRASAIAAQTDGARVIVPGRWYWLHPDEHPTQEGGLTLDLPEFAPGAW